MKKQILNFLLVVISITSFGQSFTVTTNTTPNYCDYVSGTATAIPSDTCPSHYKYLWNNHDTTQTIINLTMGTYFVTVTCDANTATAVATVLSSDSPPCGIINIHNDTNGHGSGSMTANMMFNIEGGFSPWMYTWSTVPTQTTKTAINLPAGTYTVTITDSFACSCTCYATIYNTSAINEINKDFDIYLFPNPATDKFTIEAKDLRVTNYELRIEDVVGNIVLEKTLVNNITNIDVSALSSGVYFVEIKTEKGIESRKFIKL